MKNKETQLKISNVASFVMKTDHTMNLLVQEIAIINSAKSA